MKILFVLHGFPPHSTGGTERTVEALALAMIEAGHEVSILAGSLEVGPTDQVDECEHRGMQVLRVHRDDLYFESWWKSYHPGVSATVADVLERVNPDVVHVHHWLRLTSDVVRLARAAGIKAVVTLHDYYPATAQHTRLHDDTSIEVPAGSAWMTEQEAGEDFELHRRDFRAELGAADLILAPSEAHAAGIRDAVGEDLGTIVVSAPPMLAMPPPMTAAPVPGGSRLLTWGGLYPEKGLETLLDAMRAAGGDWSLRVMGMAHDPDYQRELTNFSAGLEVEFTGPFEAADLATVEADYAVLPTLCLESYGLVVDEAQALGLPMIVSDVPAYREHSPADATVFFPPGDAASLTMILLDPDALAKLQRPSSPSVWDAAGCAADLLGRYEAIDARPAYSPDTELERSRARALFRRAERRLWSALNVARNWRERGPGDDSVPLPPDDFLQ